jgi:hypothetical protein
MKRLLFILFYLTSLAGFSQTGYVKNIYVQDTVFIITSDTGFIYTDGDTVVIKNYLKIGTRLIGADIDSLIFYDSTNTGLGVGVLANLTTGYRNNAFGEKSLNKNSNGNFNNAYGFNSLRENVSGIYNNAYGDRALLNNTSGSYNNAFGSECLLFNETGNSNNGHGYLCLERNVGGTHNSGYGSSSLRLNIGGDFNSGYGSASLGNNQDGSNNSGFGRSALNSNISGDDNTAIGYEAGFGVLGSGGVYLGKQAGYNETGSNFLYIENSNSATPLIGGDFANDKVTINSSIASADSTFYVTGGGHFTGGLIVDKDVQIQGQTAYTPSGDLSLSTNDSITVTKTLMRVVGSGGAVTSIGVNDGSYDGQFLYIQGTDNTNTVTITDGLNVELDGGVNVVLGQGDMLGLAWDDGDNTWYMITKSNN